jgi:hypothetical protein
LQQPNRTSRLVLDRNDLISADDHLHAAASIVLKAGSRDFIRSRWLPLTAG